MEYIISTEKLNLKECKMLLDGNALPGVKRIAGTVAHDMELVFGTAPEILFRDITKQPDLKEIISVQGIMIGTLGHSRMLEQIESQGLLSFEEIRGKREVYAFLLLECPDGGSAPSLVIAGSDKRGTIYGLFHLSELLGVSPLVKWNQVRPVKRSRVSVTERDQIISREPSVRFRGFFINDEWPAFGNWCNRHFGGFTKDCYADIFELLLRMKGNYLWPAMWSSIFSDDGPGLLNAELADELGIVMGLSHHEPCLRHGEEYKYLRGKDSVYGDAWDFSKNEAGITRFWKDGLIRSGKYENVITVGMRGEADSTIMGEDATLKDNIDLLRKVLKCQNDLIRSYVNPDLEKVPRMFALYKEVEPFYYGDEKTQGLMDCRELDGVTLMLCDDNFGNLRTVPTEQMKTHPGGFGMYYHFDYHGSPISYEWVNSSYLPKIWEQMTSAYEFGIRELWIVNVGDLFSMEYPLSFFLDLAYDYDTWGINNLNAPREYTKQWVERQFGERMEKADLQKTEDLLMSYTKIAGTRRPEAMNAEVYRIAYEEAPRHGKLCAALMEECRKLRERLPEISDFSFFQLVYYPLMGNLNIHKLWTDVAINHYLADIKATIAASYAEKVRRALEFDKELVEELHTIEGGRWYGMGMSEHIGFRNWNEEECQYPVLYEFAPANKKRIIVEIPGTRQHTEGGDWTRRTLRMKVFQDPDVSEAVVHLYSGSMQDAAYSISCEDTWISFDSKEGIVPAGGVVVLKVQIDRTVVLTEKKGSFTVHTQAGGNVQVEVSAAAKGTVSEQEYIVFEAADYSQKLDTSEGCFKELPEYGRTRSAMKAFPVNRSFIPGKGPSLCYSFFVPEVSEYVVTLYMSPCNPAFTDQKLLYGFCLNQDELKICNAVPEGYRVENGQECWQRGVLDNIRINQIQIECRKGENSITLQALSPFFVLQKIVISPRNMPVAQTYLGPGKGRLETGSKDNVY